MKFADIDRLLDPTPLALEMGHERQDDGVLHVAIRTDMRGCSGAMLDWWFEHFRPDTRAYRWWHPLDHVSSSWAEGEAGRTPGVVHHVVERFTGPETSTLAIQFYEPETVFSPDRLQAARSAGAVSALLCARGGPGPEPRRDAEGAVIGTRLVHLARDTPWGMALRTHFFMGQDLPALGVPAAALRDMFPDDHAVGLLQHCYDEFSFLARFLPSLYEAERADGVAPPRPW